MGTHKSRHAGRKSSSLKRTGRKHKHANRNGSLRFKLPRCEDDDNNSLLSLPLEVHEKVLSHLPLNAASSCRRVFQFYFEIVSGNERAVARPHIDESIAKLKAEVEEIKMIGRPPTDADSFLNCLGLWISRRGTFECHSESRLSLQNWFKFIFDGNESDDNPARRWTQLAVQVVYPWRQFIAWKAQFGWTGPLEWERQKFVYRSEWSASINAELLEEIWSRIYDSRIFDHPHFQESCTEWWVTDRETITFPNPEGRHRQWRLTDLVWKQIEIPAEYDEDVVKRAAGDAQALIEPLGLPALPSPIFCYYAEGT
jgi:hypothetical protein